MGPPVDMMVKSCPHASEKPLASGIRSGAARRERHYDYDNQSGLVLRLHLLVPFSCLIGKPTVEWNPFFLEKVLALVEVSTEFGEMWFLAASLDPDAVHCRCLLHHDDGVRAELARGAMARTQVDRCSEREGNLVERWHWEGSANLLLDLGAPGFQDLAATGGDIQGI